MMIKNQVAVSPKHRIPIPIVPTLVIGIGKYGREVGVQLVARLMLTQDGLRSEGLHESESLLVHKDGNGNITHGFVRVMELNWKQWAGNGYTTDSFLTDIDISGASVAEEGTTPQQREDDMLSSDENDALQALPDMLHTLAAVSNQLRMHDNPMKVGRYLILSKDEHFTMRVVVVAAAREAETATLLPRFLELLGQVYVGTGNLARGIQVICYAGATSRDEHRRAHGDDNEYNQLLGAELRRILPIHHRQARGIHLTGNGLLDEFETLWQKASPPIIESCYVIDTQLANGVSAVQLRPDEPDETIIVAALALTMFITCSADAILRRTRSKRWNLKSAYTKTEQGLFTSLGAGSYALDHPRLRRLVYDYVAGMFLERAQPVRYGDQGNRRNALAGHLDDEIKDNKRLEGELRDDLIKALESYREAIDFRAIEPKMPKAPTESSEKAIDYKKAIAVLERIDPSDRIGLKDELERVSIHMAAAMEEQALQRRIQKRQQRYQELLDNEALKYQGEMLRDIHAPLVQMYRFTMQSFDVLVKEAKKANAPVVGPDLLMAKRDFAAERSRRYDEEMTRRVDEIKLTLKYRPKWIPSLLRGITFAPLLSTLFIKFAPLVAPMFALLSSFGIAPALVSAYGIISAIPAWVNLLGIGLPFGIGFFLAHRDNYRRRLTRHLQELVKYYLSLLKEADAEAWRWALAEAASEKEALANHIRPLCRPGGVISRLRFELQEEQFVAREQVLERIVFDAELQKNLKEISRQLMQLGLMWEQRQTIFKELISGHITDKEDIRKWLREEAERIYSKDTQRIIDLVSDFFEEQTAQRLREMWYELSTVAVPFLRHSALSQDEPSLTMELFSSHGPRNLVDLESIVERVDVEILDGADRLRWLFMRVRLGMHLESMKFDVEAQIH